MLQSGRVTGRLLPAVLPPSLPTPRPLLSRNLCCSGVLFRSSWCSSTSRRTSSSERCGCSNLPVMCSRQLGVALVADPPLQQHPSLAPAACSAPELVSHCSFRHTACPHIHVPILERQSRSRAPSHPAAAYMLSFLLPHLLESVVETLLFGNIIYWVRA